MPHELRHFASGALATSTSTEPVFIWLPAESPDCPLRDAGAVLCAGCPSAGGPGHEQL